METVVRPGSLRGWPDLVTQLGGDPPALLRSASLAEDALTDEDTPISARGAMALLELSANSLDCPDFGLRLSLFQDVDALGPLTAVLRNASTIRATLDLASEWLFVHSPALRLSIEEDGDRAAIVFDLLLEPHPPARQTVELGLATCHRMFVTVIGSSYRPLAVWLPHTPLAPLTRYVQFFSATVHPEGRDARLVVPRRLLDERVPGADEAIRANALAFLESRFPRLDATITERVRHLLFRTLGTEDDDYRAVARSLSMHPRTLQRRLRAEATTFEQIKDDVLRTTAHRYLTESDISATQLSQVLGLSESSALSRASRRWFGMSPREVRQRQSKTRIH
ncbi:MULTISPECIES: AraC family transcriptional regulator [unclassified Streptomyces]|uniref:AraC family transcriptional regulator n=1 Tax=unclassified Streptomyces TaxID=2593676 RepID=UPI002ED50E2F|nr:AraC family transcriptional regulator [Streptomyces sp. NBC_00891]WSY09593.1 AraC family transcriptional regulator [Streptomyces sp. NBC_00890]WSZ11213.1 AraC family transcriptional regulator [Streptomyces sp. NBC_00869]WSZ21281.1 AraC family transcriptional regulator [Streptomyces sp. NBC_00870]